MGCVDRIEEEEGGQNTFARFLRHSVQALGVTTPRPRRRLELCWALLFAAAEPEAFDGVLVEDWAEVGVGFPCD